MYQDRCVDRYQMDWPVTLLMASTLYSLHTVEIILRTRCIHMNSFKCNLCQFIITIPCVCACTFNIICGSTFMVNDIPHTKFECDYLVLSGIHIYLEQKTINPKMMENSPSHCRHYYCAFPYYYYYYDDDDDGATEVVCVMWEWQQQQQQKVFLYFFFSKPENEEEEEEDKWCVKKSEAKHQTRLLQKELVGEENRKCEWVCWNEEKSIDMPNEQASKVLIV